MEIFLKIEKTLFLKTASSIAKEVVPPVENLIV
jgi:hypothetical protein